MFEILTLPKSAVLTAKVFKITDTLRLMFNINIMLFFSSECVFLTPNCSVIPVLHLTLEEIIIKFTSTLYLAEEY